MDISVTDNQSFLSIDSKSVAEVAKKVILAENQPCDQLNVYFVDVETICELHDQFFNDPSPTDCISIEIDGPDESPRHLGEIFISTKAAIDYCSEDPQATYQELSLYLIHGLLHLMGYDDTEDSLRDEMRLAEKRHIDYLLKNDMLIKKGDKAG